MEESSFLSPEDDNIARLIGDCPPDPTIKSEEIKDDDILFFTQFGTLPNTGGNDNDFHILPQIDLTSATVPEGLEMPQEGFNAKLPLELGLLSGFEEIKSEAASHFMKFKEQDGKSVKIWGCGICGKEFGHQYTLMRHLPTHTDERKFHCNTCGKAFRQMSTLSQHRAIHSSERPYVCEVCQKNFNRVSTLISHRKTHTGLKPHQCHLCNKAFHQKGNLRNHVFTHTNERPYKCEICKKGFNQMSNLMCHKLKMHQHTESPKYICKICGKDFLKRASLRNHEQFKHGVDNEAEHSTPADKMDYSNAIIVEPITTEAMHLAIESGETPFALLRPLSGIPVLVRVLPAGDKQMLVPATAEDLKKYGQISITSKEADSNNAAVVEKDNNKENSGAHQKPLGSVVQIKVPVVATVIQQRGQGGHLSVSVVSPGPNEIVGDSENMANTHTDSYVYSSTLTESSVSNATNQTGAGNGNESSSIGTMALSSNFFTTSQMILNNDTSTGFQFLNKEGNNVDFLDKSLQLNNSENIERANLNCLIGQADQSNGILKKCLMMQEPVADKVNLPENLNDSALTGTIPDNIEFIML